MIFYRSCGCEFFQSSFLCCRCTDIRESQRSRYGEKIGKSSKLPRLPIHPDPVSTCHIYYTYGQHHTPQLANRWYRRGIAWAYRFSLLPKDGAECRRDASVSFVFSGIGRSITCGCAAGLIWGFCGVFIEDLGWDWGQ